MTSELLGESYFKKAKTRLKILSLLIDEGDYSDVVREAQEIVELALKGILRKIGVEPPKPQKDTERIAEISKWLRKEREFAFYGDVDLIPSEEYKRADAERAKKDAEFVVAWVRSGFV